MKKRTLNEFILLANKVHGNFYSYETTIYISSHEKLEIVCPTHGLFTQTAANHLRGHGCPTCKSEKLGSMKRKSLKDFIKQAKQTHEDLYDYTCVNYINDSIKVEIHCSKHGPFYQTPNNHLRGSGCAKCGITRSKGEERISKVLTNLNVSFEEQKSFSDLKGKRKRLLYDFWLPDYNMLIEYDGIQHHRKHSFTKDKNRANDNHVALRENDHVKTQYAQAHHIELIRIPYTEYSNIEVILTDRLQQP